MTRGRFLKLEADTETIALAGRLFYYMPKSASRLDMIETEFPSVVRECPNRRVSSIERLEEEALALVKERSRKKIEIHWRFSRESAGNKLNRHHQHVFRR